MRQGALPASPRAIRRGGRCAVRLCCPACVRPGRSLFANPCEAEVFSPSAGNFVVAGQLPPMRCLPRSCLVNRMVLRVLDHVTRVRVPGFGNERNLPGRYALPRGPGSAVCATSHRAPAAARGGLATPAGPGIPGGVASAYLADRGARDAATWDPRRREESEARGGCLG